MRHLPHSWAQQIEHWFRLIYKCYDGIAGLCLRGSLSPLLTSVLRRQSAVLSVSVKGLHTHNKQQEPDKYTLRWVTASTFNYHSVNQSKEWWNNICITNIWDDYNNVIGHLFINCVWLTIDCQKQRSSGYRLKASPLPCPCVNPCFLKLVSLKAKASKILFGPIKAHQSISPNGLQRPEQFWNKCNTVYLSGLQNSIQAY